jgi:hypothetical protein
VRSRTASQWCSQAGRGCRYNMGQAHLR